MSKKNRIIKKYEKNKTQALKTQIVEMYTHIIERKAAKAAVKYGISAIDYTQELYLKLLENLDRYTKETEPAKLLNKFLQKIEPDEDDFMSTADIPVDELSEGEEEKIAYNLNNKEGQLDFSTIMPLIKKVLNEKEFFVLSERLDGTDIDEIAKALDTRRASVRCIFERATRRIKHSEYRPMLTDLTYDDKHSYLPVILADKPLK